jgi:hypothetical protein
MQRLKYISLAASSAVRHHAEHAEGRFNQAQRQNRRARPINLLR